MQKEKINRPFLNYWKFISYYDFPIQKAIELQNKVIGRLLFLFRENNNNASVLRKIIPYSLSGFSIIFIGYVLMNILTNSTPLKSNRD